MSTVFRKSPPKQDQKQDQNYSGMKKPLKYKGKNSYGGPSRI